ncbi:MAG TPA: tRNA preQ1(34) S-adenosylmethionine ribosyltransferase-isomerase QueA [Candidatus Caenarcaniphilales bacterium]
MTLTDLTSDGHPASSSDITDSAIAVNHDADQLLVGYDYDLPAAQIAQNPAIPRDSARLLVVDTAEHRHCVFRDLPSQLQPGDRLVFNNTRVIPARLFGRRSTGQSVEVLLVEKQPHQCWLALVKPGKRLKPGACIEFGTVEQPSLSATVLAIDPTTGGRILQFHLPAGESLEQYLHQLGQIPFPPYIKASQAHPDQYQTIYATQPGAIAAPTAGLHFTPALLDRLQAQGIDHSFITLHVGVGTFRPVEADRITTHTMHAEWVEVPVETVQQIRQTQAQGGRVIAVGTTVARALEGVAQTGKLHPYEGKINLFIYPPYTWRVVDGLITNFHLPCSSLLMLVSALVGRERLMALYKMAIAHQYRFYSFGDAMLILPTARNCSKAQPL